MWDDVKQVFGFKNNLLPIHNPDVLFVVERSPIFLDK